MTSETVKDGQEPTERSGDTRVGAIVQALRARSGLSLRTLAARSGFSPSFISQVEHGQASPSIGSLEKIATALGVSLSEFFNEVPGETVPPSVTIVRASQRPEIVSDWSKATIESLSALGARQPFDVVMLHLAPDGRSGTRTPSPETSEFIYILTGNVRLVLESATFDLGSGDAITLSARPSHQWHNIGDTPATLMIVAHQQS